MKKVIFVADSLDNAHKFQQVLSEMDVEVFAGSSAHFKTLLAHEPSCDLVIFEVSNSPHVSVSEAEALLFEDGVPAMLLIVRPEQLPDFRLPVQVCSDFVTTNATADECSVRIRLLLWPGSEPHSGDIINIDNMTINLATYQVRVNGEPLDFTYLEYALLAFLVTHPGRTYSRDTLLRRVWGFDYYGGSRTVDVHVRRVRAKLGPDLAQRLETVRGVGYLWNI